MKSIENIESWYDEDIDEVVVVINYSDGSYHECQFDESGIEHLFSFVGVGC